MNFATITAAQVCNTAIVSLSVLFLFLVIDGLVGSAIACWQDVTRKPSPVTDAPIAYHYACPLTCELPAPVATQEPVEEPTQAVETQEPQQVIEQPSAPVKRLTFAQQVKLEASEFFGYEIKTKGDLKSSIINRSNTTFMQAVNLERSGNDFYKAAQDHINRLKAEKAKRAIA